MPAPLVTVCIPTYNRSGLPRGALQSVLWQSLRDIEVVVSDNASPRPSRAPTAGCG